LSADLAGWDLTATYGDLLTLLHAEAYMAVHRDPKKPVIELLHPWPDAPQEDDVSPEERERLKAMLRASSPFRDMP
jgi:hypothetical protein